MDYEKLEIETPARLKRKIVKLCREERKRLPRLTAHLIALGLREYRSEKPHGTK